MEKRDAILMLLLLGGAAYGIHANWDKIVVRLGLNDLTPDRLKATELAKHARGFDQYRSNWEILRDRLANDEIQYVGDPWTAEPIDDRHYRVLCSFREKSDDQMHRHEFEVDLVTTAVTYVGEVESPSAPGK